MDSSTKQAKPLEPDVKQSSLAPSPLPTALTAETPSKTKQPATNSFHATAATFLDHDLADENRVRSGALIDGYVVVKTIASTKMSVVFQARQPDTGQMVALKLIQSGFSDRQSLDRFQQEIRALGQMQPHKNIVPIYHVGRYEKELYYVMPYLAGGSLSKHLERFQKDCRKSVGLMEKVARAVHQLHTQTPKILHRDIKPANILLSAEDEPLLADFGLIKLLDDEHGLTRTHSRPGTPPYMAPEQTGLVPTPASERTDIWALGVVLYELLVGKRPFQIGDGEDTSQLFWRIVHAYPQKPRSIRPDLDPGLEAIALKCLEKDPADRYASAAELADDLARWLKGDPVRTPPPPSRVARFINKHARTLAAVLLLCVAVTVGAPAAVRYRQLSPLRGIQAQIQAGDDAVLIAEKGEPTWSEWLHQEGAQMALDKDGYCSINATVGKRAMLEMVRNIPAESYRLRGKIRHEKSEMFGKVGVFFGHRAKRVEFGNYDLYYQVYFNDVIAPAKILPLQRDFPSAVYFAPVLFARTKNDIRLPHTAFAHTAVAEFRPALLAGGQWRQLEITVTADRLHLRFDDNPLFTINLENRVKELPQEMEDLILHDPANLAVLRSCDLSFNPSGSLGIFVEGGSAAFSNFVLEPLQTSKEGE